MSPGLVLLPALILGGLTALAVIAGGVVLFATGRARGALPGVGFVLLGIGVGATALVSLLIPSLQDSLDLTASTVSSLSSGIYLLFALIGWGLVIIALFRFRAEQSTTSTGYPPQQPGGYPPPGPYGPPAGQYGRPPEQPGPAQPQPPYGRPGGSDSPWGPPPGA